MVAKQVTDAKAASSRLAKSWISAFNSHDLERILALYADDVILSSELHWHYSNGETNLLHGKDALRRYFGRGLERFPKLRFELHTIYPGINSVCVVYHTLAHDKMACECMVTDADNLVVQVFAHYLD